MENYKIKKFIRQYTRNLINKISMFDKVREIPFKLTKYDIELSRTDTTITFKRYSSKTYEQVVEDLIRIRYTVSAELAILRQKSVKEDEYTAYYVYCEECKAYAKQLIAERKNAIGI